MNTVRESSAQPVRYFSCLPMLSLAAVILILAFAPAPMAWAHGGEEHSHDEGLTDTVAVTAALGAKAGFETASGQVELVGRYREGLLILYVDDFATNAPLTGLRVEISADDQRVMATERAPGEYTATLPWVQAPAQYPLVFLLESEALTDLLQATLDTQKMDNVEPGAPASAVGTRKPQRWGWGAAAALALVLMLAVGILIGRGMATKRQNSSVGGLLLIVGLAFAPAELRAHGGEDHSHDLPAAESVIVAESMTGDTPRRLPDGRVFIPKSTQRLLAIRTLLTAVETSHRSVTLNGRVIADPAASGVVQAGQAGRIEPGRQGFPVLGQQVQAGQVLATLAPLTTSLERGNQQALLADITAQLALAESKQKRLASLQGSVPKKEIEAARLETDSLRQRQQAVTRSLYQKEPLTAPVAGVISTTDAVAGQVVSEGALLFTVVQPDRLWVEALAYDPMLLTSDDKAVAQAGSLTVNLTRLGTGAALRDQSIPLHFRIDAPVPLLPVGQPVTVLVKTQQALNGIPVPVDALARNAEGQWVVWMHESAEIFKPVEVQSEPLDGQHAMITHGLPPATRVVGAGAASLGQIR